MRDAQWNGPDSSDTASCPYRVDFECTPAPADSLNSLESGRLILTVKLSGEEEREKEVRAVAVKLVNMAKQENLASVEGSSELKRKTSLSASLARDSRHPGWWAGVIGIPVTWTEGGTADYERSGSWHPKNKGNLFAMEITYSLDDGSNCTARFSSRDAYHWAAR